MGLRAGRLTACLGAVVLAGCGSRPPEQAQHLVIVTIDTLRADHVARHGAVLRAPAARLLARDSAMALRRPHVPLTRPSHVTLMTGRLPSETGVRDNFASAVIPQVPLLAEVLQKAGFTTGAFVSSVVLDSSAGFGRGFDVYADRFESGGDEARFLNTVQKRGDLTTAEALAWLERAHASGKRVFLWLHLYDPHDPYEPPEPYASRFAGRPYDGEIAFADDLVGRLDDALARMGMRDRTALVVTSDHGEGLGEHGETLHGFFAYQTTLSVPFFARGPGVRPGTRLPTTVRLVDVFPTVLDPLGLATSGPAAGPQPGSALAGGPRRRAGRGAESRAAPALRLERPARPARGTVQVHPGAARELYDLKTDPGEATNLLTREPARAEALRKALGALLDAERAQAKASGTPAPIAPELLEKLGALGYVGGEAPADTPTPGADPKDRIEDFRIANDLIREGLTRLHDRDFAGSAERFRAVLARGIESFEVHFYLARAASGLGQHAEAARHFEEAAKRSPAHAPAWMGLARSLLALGRKAEARRAYETALPLAPTSGPLRAELGDLLREQGDAEGAIRLQTEATRLSPDVAAYWNSLGMTLGGNRRPADAERAFREATRLDATNHRYAYNLGLVLRDQGRPAEARPWFEKALAIDPRFSPARERLRELQ
jgi:arylsulfatase A-like enzyme/Flp pilus assembly protein TadD